MSDTLFVLDPNIGAHLNQLEASDLIRMAQTQPELEYLFRHSLVQDAAYSSLLRQDRRRLHDSVGKILEHLYQDNLDENAAVLAAHFLEAGDDERALKYYSLAAEHAAGQYANAEASMHYECAISIAQRIGSPNQLLSQLVAGYGRVLELSARYDEALAQYDELGKRGQQSGDLSLLLEALSRSATIHSIPSARYDAARGEAESMRALELARKLGNPKAEARIWWNLQLAYNFNGRHHEAVEAAEKSLAIAREYNLREQMAYTLNDVHAGYILIGQPEKGMAAVKEARALWRELGNLPMLADNLSSTAEGAFLHGDLELAFRSAQEGFEIGVSIGNLWAQSYSLMIQSAVLYERAQFGQAVNALNRCVHLGEQSGFAIGLSAGLEIKSQLYLDLGLIEQAQQSAQLIISKADGMLPDALSWGYALLSMIHSALGDLDQAETALQLAYQDFHPTKSFSPADVFLVPAADIILACARRDYERALTLADKTFLGIQSSGMLTFGVDILLLKGKTLHVMQRLFEARQILEQAAQMANDRDCRRLLWMILAEWSQVETELGNESAAHELFEKARALVTDIAAQSHPSELQQAFLNLPVVRTLRQPQGK